MECAGKGAALRRLPFDRAADGGRLIAGLLAGGDRAHCFQELAFRAGRRWAGAAGIEPAAIFQGPRRVEAEEVRRADRTIGPRHVLTLVMEIGEGEAMLGGEAAHVVEAV